MKSFVLLYVGRLLMGECVSTAGRGDACCAAFNDCVPNHRIDDEQVKITRGAQRAVQTPTRKMDLLSQRSVVLNAPCAWLGIVVYT